MIVGLVIVSVSFVLGLIASIALRIHGDGKNPFDLDNWGW